MTSCLLTLSPNRIVELKQDELPEEVPGRHAEGHRKVSGPGPGKQGDYLAFHSGERNLMTDELYSLV